MTMYCIYYNHTTPSVLYPSQHSRTKTSSNCWYVWSSTNTVKLWHRIGCMYVSTHDKKSWRCVVSTKVLDFVMLLSRFSLGYKSESKGSHMICAHVKRFDWCFLPKFLIFWYHLSGVGVGSDGAYKESGITYTYTYILLVASGSAARVRFHWSSSWSHGLWEPTRIGYICDNSCLVGDCDTGGLN